VNRQLTAALASLVLTAWSHAPPALALGDEDGGTLGIVGDRDPRVLYAASVRERVVALTLDDGPDPATTPALLAVLRRHRARATFFVLGERIRGNEQLLAEIVAQGHELGNHMARDEPSIRLDADEFEAELVRATRALTPFGDVRWFRPGSGYYDDAMLDIVERHGLRCALGLVYPIDAHVPWSWFAQAWIRWRVEPGAIIILHDGGKRGARAVTTLEKVLPWLREREYRIVTLGELARLEETSSRAMDSETGRRRRRPETARSSRASLRAALPRSR
jgi:peptidoglycan/xylan/chitin deacetylase (PgdA/CDA1 family)